MKPGEEINATCPVCGSANAEYLHAYHYHSPLFADCRIVACRTCGMVFADPMPGEQALDAYNAGYFENAHGGMQLHPVTVAFHSAINRLRAEHVSHFAKQHNKTISDVLEVGPGAGYFAKHWMGMNACRSYTGLESDSSCHPHLASLGINVKRSVQEIAAGQTIDLVVISHVLEHTSHPIEFISACTRQLKSGGILFIEVPCLDFKHKDYAEPHLLFFDKPAMELLLTKTGFTDSKISYFGRRITDLQKPLSKLTRIAERVRNAMLSRNILFPFSATEKGLENMPALERASIKPHLAHVEQEQASWWLRSLAIKK